MSTTLSLSVVVSVVMVVVVSSASFDVDIIVAESLVISGFPAEHKCLRGKTSRGVRAPVKKYV